MLARRDYDDLEQIFSTRTSTPPTTNTERSSPNSTLRLPWPNTVLSSEPHQDQIQAHSQKIAKKVPLTTTCSMALVQPLAFISTLATPTGSPCS